MSFKSSAQKTKEALGAKELLCWADFNQAAVRFRAGTKQYLLVRQGPLPDYWRKDLCPSADISPINETTMSSAISQASEFHIVFFATENNPREECFSAVQMQQRLNAFFRGMA